VLTVGGKLQTALMKGIAEKLLVFTTITFRCTTKTRWHDNQAQCVTT